MADVKWTRARLDGLAVFAVCRQPKMSNVTDADKCYVYWQTVNWMRANGLVETVAARPTDRPTDVRLQLTEAGHRAALEMGVTE